MTKTSIEIDFSKSPDEARIVLCNWIQKHIEGQGWSRREAGRHLELPYPAVSRICNRKPDGISLEKLLSTVERAGGQVTITVR
ncbi:XRE family transcriptional regulator [Ruegeria atlantica]|uniref:XRE family transcriptional regulator n=1 Tax=Ruegeria atlantica TaxID=81569 RepID=UPI003D7CFE05